MNPVCPQINCFMLSPLSFAVLSKSEYVYDYAYICMSMAISLLHMGIFCLKNSIFSPQVLKEVPGKDDGECGREDGPEYSTGRQKLFSEKH